MSALAGLTPPGPRNAAPAYRRDPAPKGWEPSVRFARDGVTPEVITTPPMGQLDPTEWNRAVESMGLTVPDGYLLRLVEAKYDPAAWHRDKEFVEHPDTGKATKAPAVTRPVWRYRFVVEETKAVTVDDLLADISKARPKPPELRTGDAFVCAVGDTQIGEWSPDGGTAAVVDRFQRMTVASIARAKRLKRQHNGVVYLPWVGDCIQGLNSQRGALIMRTDLTLSEMTRVYRRLLLWQVEQWAKVAAQVVVPVVPGNHDDVHRLAEGPSTRYDDSWAIEGASAVADALELAGGYEHVSFVFPQPDEDTITLDTGGAKIGLAHGHQWPGDDAKGHEWWARQAHGRTPIGDADILLTGHRHHYFAREAGDGKLLVIVPAMVGASQHWKRAHGDDVRPGMISLLVGDGGWTELDVAR